MGSNPLDTQLNQWIQAFDYQNILVSSQKKIVTQDTRKITYLQSVEDAENENTLLEADISQEMQAFDALLIKNNYLENPSLELPSLLKTLKTDGHILLTLANTQYFRFVQDYYKNGLSQTYYLQGRIPSLQYNLDFLTQFLTPHGYAIQSILALADQQFFELYQEFSQKESISIQIDRTTSVSISNPFELLKYLSCYFALLIVPQAQLKDKTHIRFTPYTIEDVQSLLYEDPIKYWKEFGHYYATHELLFEMEKQRVEAEAAFLANEIQILNPRSILEVGCAYGRNLKALKQVLPKSLVTGIDISSEQLKQAQSYLQDRSIQLHLCEANQPLPFKDNEFELVFTSGVLCILPEKMARYLCQEMARVSKHLIVHNESAQPEDYRFFAHQIENFYPSDKVKVRVLEGHYVDFKLWLIETPTDDKSL